MRAHTLLLTGLFATILSGCTVGPDFERPAAPDETSYDNKDPTVTVAADGQLGNSQTFVPNETLPGEWWTLFQSPPLNDMITEALLHNPDLEAAQASLRVAEEDLAAEEGVQYPTISGNFSGTREKTSGNSNGGKFAGSLYSVFNASVNLSYGVDIFGITRRALEQLEAQREYQAFELEAARLTISSNVVTTAIKEASLRGQIAATQKIIDEEKKQVEIYKKQLEAGGITRQALLAEESTLAQTRAGLPSLEKQLAQTRHALSVLIGQMPSHAPKASFELDNIHLPEKLPISLPSQLVEQRPDVRAAEANLHAASAAIGIAEANRLPQFLISADIGSVAGQIEKLFTPGGGIWSVGGSLAETIFDAGTLEHKEDSAKASYDVAAAMYRKTVLGAFQDVADTLRAIEADAKTLQAQGEAERTASDSLKLAQTQYDSGAISYLSLLDAQNTEQKARIGLVQAEAARLADTAALFQALGGGWMSQKNTKDETP